MSKRFSKKGQVTIFIILGLLFVIGTAVYVYYSNKISDASTKPNLPKLTGDAGQVQAFVENCIDQVGHEGIVELGRHGGYIAPLDPTYTPMKFKYDTLKQTESDMAFLTASDTSSGIPYWYYATSENECWHCSVSSLAPPVDLMTYQLSKYVANNLDSCTRKFKTFEEQGLEVLELTNVTVSVSLSDTTVNILTNYTIQIIKNGDSSYIEAFYKELDIPLLQYYRIAVNITQNEINNEYLDVFGLYLLGQYSDLDSRKLPPISAYRLGYDSVFWSKFSVTKSYESLLSSYVQFFRITGTKNDIAVALTSRPIEQNMYKLMRLPLFATTDYNALKLSDLEITHIYSGQSIYLNINPSNGDLVSPFVNKDTSEFSKALGEVKPDQNYDFFYDISYPIIVEIRDTRVGHEYSFMIALQGNIKENKLLSKWLAGEGTITWDNNYISTYDNIPLGTTLVDPTTGENYTYEQSQPSKSLFCDKDQQLSGDITVRTYDAVTNEPLNGATVKYYCGSYSSCYMGRSTYDRKLDESVFRSKFPICQNGYLQIEKENYLAKKVLLTTKSGVSDYIGAVYLEPIFVKDYSVTKHYVERNTKDVSGSSVTTGYVLDTNSVPLSDNDTVILTLRRVSFDDLEEPWTQTMILGKEGIEGSQLKLVSGAYMIDAQLLDYNGVVVPKECKEICVDDTVLSLVTCTKWKKIPENDINIEVAMWGGIVFDENNTIVITAQDLQSDNILNFNIVRMPDPRCLDDMNEATMTGYVAKKYRKTLMPDFVVIDDSKITEEIIS